MDDVVERGTLRAEDYVSMLDAFTDDHPGWRLRATFEKARVCNRLAMSLYDVLPRLPLELRRPPPLRVLQDVEVEIERARRPVVQRSIAQLAVAAERGDRDGTAFRVRSNEDVATRDAAARVRDSLDLFRAERMLRGSGATDPARRARRAALARQASLG